MKFSVNNYDGARNITLKNYNDHLIRMGGVRGQIPPHPKIKHDITLYLKK